MSGFIARTAGFDAQTVRANVNPSVSKGDWSQWASPDTLSPWADAVLWPCSRWSGGANAFIGNGVEMNRWAAPPEFTGGAQMRKFRGITRDSTGAVLASSVVQAFLTSSDLFLRQVTSDAGGYFELPSEYAATNHFLVAYKAGSPDVAGTTVNTLQPT